MSRRTVANRMELDGVGLHLGRPCRLAFVPAAPDSGIRFRRVDLEGQPETSALVEHAIESERRTQLGEGERALHTVEHVLAAIVGAEIDDVIIEMDAAEPPILDGSAMPFLDALMKAGAREQRGEVLDIRLHNTLRVESGESVYVVEAGARTFGFFHEVEALRAKGLIQGASTDNALALDADGIVGNTLRWPDEFVRHKALDVVGDLALAGRRVRGKISAVKPSHRGTVALVRAMLAQSRREGQLENRVIEAEELMKILPHRYPFLLVDRILQIEEGKRIVGIKNVTINEPFFQGHFPGHPIMPGVLIVEAMAQVSCPLLMGTVSDHTNKVVYFMSLDKVKFRKPVRPGDTLRFELEMTQVRGRICRMYGVAKVDGEIVCEAEMAAIVRDR
ncbi:MAG: 3-hydroxyacyl-ACP dehydratase FabZ [Gemmatimonadetes bacterium]|nr:3-hydroxyacyl-ACP dehydratase FabZ [Gemmatimonadota bacterium]